VTNKYQMLYSEITADTNSGKITWKQENRGAYSHVVFSSNTVRRLFSAKFERNGDEYTLLLAEKKYDDPDFDMAYEKYKVELLVLDHGELVVTLDNSTVDVDQLADVVETKSDRAKKLFGPKL
jgi:hypothetical protein